MADPEKIPESQDFRLVDEESVKLDLDETQLSQKKDDTPEKPVETVVVEEKVDEYTSGTPSAILKTDEKSETLQEPATTCDKVDEKKEKLQSDNDDDDFVPSSQVEALSPLKKQTSSIFCVASQKRKAETEEQVAKFPRTCSQENAFSSVRKNLDDEKDIFDTADDSMDVGITTDEIIPETQETGDKDDKPESLQDVELEETLSQINAENIKTSDIDDTEKSDPVEENSAEIKSSGTEVSEENILTTKTEATEPKISLTEETVLETKITETDAEVPAETEVVDEIKTSNGDATEKGTNEDSTEAKKSSNDDASEKIISPVADENKSSQMEDSTVDSNNLNAEKAEVSDSSIKEPEKVDSTLDPAMDVDSETVDTKDNEVNSDSKIDNNGVSSETSETSYPSIQVSSNKSRMSIEVIYDKATAPPEKKRPRELVVIDEDGEKTVLDSSQENCDKSMDKITIANKTEAPSKSCDSTTNSSDDTIVGRSKENDLKVIVERMKPGHSMTNGSSEGKKNDSDKTNSPGSDFADEFTRKKDESSSPTKKSRIAPAVLISISDSEGDSFVSDERATNKLEPVNQEHSTIKIVEKEISILVKIKCLVHIDESTKEQVEKVITTVQSEPANHQDLSAMLNRRNSDTSACLADISGNRDNSPGSVNSNPHPYPLVSRLSLASTVSSSSSASSAASLHTKLTAKGQFQLPRVPVKHIKKLLSGTSTPDGKNDATESWEQNNKDWKNLGLLVSSILSCARDELAASELHNGSAERVLANDSSLERIRSSTPEHDEKDKPLAQAVTPKNIGKRNRSTKRSRSKNLQSSGTNGLRKISSSSTVEPEVDAPPVTPSSNRKRKSSPETPSQQGSSSKELTDNSDELVGREVFAKWSDNKYYPGTVVSKTKTKYRVNFYDGQHKLIIEDFIVAMPEILQNGLSVYATSSKDEYDGSCGIITNSKKVKDNVIYTVQTDEQEELRVQIKNIFLTSDQVQVLKEESKEELLSPPSTPKHLGKVTLDNVVDGTRRSKRIATPVVSTPKAKRLRGSHVEKNIDIPTSSGSASTSSSKPKMEDDTDTASDSNFATLEDTELLGVQPELNGMPPEEDIKGSSSKDKGKTRTRKRSNPPEDPEIITKLGPIPPANSNIFNGMSFILTCASLELLDRFQTDTKDSNSDPGTENEEEWMKRPFVRERLTAQINAGGGKVYKDFEQIPPKEYERTKLISNVPNLTKKSLLCLSVGIKAYNHQWIIRCCEENKVVNPSEEELPAGWSLMKQSYVEMFERRNKKPFQTLPVIVVIPSIPGEKDFVTFWSRICENAGGAVLLPENAGDSFIEGTVVLTNKRCPSWVVGRAKSWDIPLVSTTWVIQSLIEGKICTYDAHECFDYRYVKRLLTRE